MFKAACLQVNALLDERRILQEESDLARERDRDRYERYASRLKETQVIYIASNLLILSV